MTKCKHCRTELPVEGDYCNEVCSTAYYAKVEEIRESIRKRRKKFKNTFNVKKSRYSIRSW